MERKKMLSPHGDGFGLLSGKSVLMLCTCDQMVDSTRLSAGLDLPFWRERCLDTPLARASISMRKAAKEVM